MNHIFGFGFKPIIALDVYNVTVRSKLLYASEILPINHKMGNKLDAVQNIAFRNILGTVYGCSTTFMRILCGIPPIMKTWDYNRLKYYRKILIGELKNQLPGKVLKIGMD